MKYFMLAALLIGCGEDEKDSASEEVVEESEQEEEESEESEDTSESE